MLCTSIHNGIACVLNIARGCGVRDLIDIDYSWKAQFLTNATLVPVRSHLHPNPSAIASPWPWQNGHGSAPYMAFSKTGPSKPWNELHIQTSSSEHALFHSSTYTKLGNGQSCRFWSEWWLDGCVVSKIAPDTKTKCTDAVMHWASVPDGQHWSPWRRPAAIRASWGASTAQEVDWRCLSPYAPLEDRLVCCWRKIKLNSAYPHLKSWHCYCIDVC